MNVRELRELLEDFDDYSPVLFAHQPAWPLALEVADVVPEPGPGCDSHGTDLDEECPDCNEVMLSDEDGAPPGNTVWIVAGDHPYDRSPYAPKALFESVPA